MAFITKKMRATGLRSFRALISPSPGNNCGVFPQLGSYAAGHAALAQVFLKAFTPVFMVRAEPPHLHMEVVASKVIRLKSVVEGIEVIRE